VPEEFADAYRAAYERALAAQPAQVQSGEAPPPRAPRRSHAAADDRPPVEDAPDPEAPVVVGTHRALEGGGGPAWFETARSSTWFVPVLLVLLALLMILASYVVGRVFASSVSADSQPDSRPTVALSESSEPSSSAKPSPTRRPVARAWKGPVEELDDVEARARCTSRPGVDASGDRVDYGADNMTDGETETTWRCDGSAVGQRIRLDLGEARAVGEVGLVPGYAKTDDASGADRYAENNRITRVRWTIGDTVVVQRISPSPQDRRMRTIRVPRTTADRIVLEILAVATGPRDTTAISEVRVARAGD
jgi:hypothetical protein